jgi:NAD(P)-dependent dehydrogenase (short-subunit alcohol dehydrogenase family)
MRPAGSGTSRPTTAPAVTEEPGFAGRKIVLITGSTDGLGRATALHLASSGAHIIVHGRNRERGAEVVRAIEAEGKGRARFYAADFAALEQVREFAAAIRRDYRRLDVLVNNAGIWLEGNSRQLSADGHELHFAVNYLSGFLLTRMLLPLVTDSSGRIINVASVAQTPVQFDDVMLSRNYSDSRGYGQSKLAQVLFSFDLAAELSGRGVIVNAVHPATMMATNMVLSRGAQPRATVESGVEAVANLVENPDPGTGQYYNGLRQMRANAQAYDDAARRQLRELSMRLTGLQPEDLLPHTLAPAGSVLARVCESQPHLSRSSPCTISRKRF